jgi:RHS repeat-associated protein
LRARNQCESRTDKYNEQIKTTRQINEWRTTNISANQCDDNNSPHRATVIGDWKYTYDDNGNVTNIGTNNDPNNGETSGQLSGGNYGETHGLLSDPDTNNGETHGLLSNPADTGSNGSTSNCTTDRDDQYIWNEENRLVQTKISGESTFYVYNAGGERTIKYNSKDNETLYVDKFFQVENRELVTKHIFVGDTRIVSKLSYMKSVTADDKGFEEQNQYYYHADHLGSTSFVTCWDGRNNTAVEYEHYEYAPYGETWVEEHTDTFNYINFKFTSKELDEETGLYDFGARYLDPMTSRWMSADPAFGDYLPVTPISDEAKEHNQKLSGMGGVFNSININLYCYAGNNPIAYYDPNGRKIFDARWWGRNWDNLVDIGFSTAEMSAGIGIAVGTSFTGVGAFAGGLMAVHGGLNIATQLVKISITTFVADKMGDDYADQLDRDLPDSFVGMGSYLVGWISEKLSGYEQGGFKEKAGAAGDLVDIAIGIAISLNCEKALVKELKSFAKSSGKYLSKEQLLKLNNFIKTTEKNTVMKSVQGVVETGRDVDSYIENTKKITGN